ncbi:MAG: phosphotransferase family protein [Planctomycetota bacterium]
MGGIDPNELGSRVTDYVSGALGRPVRFLRADRLVKSSREAPWRLVVRESGEERSYVLRAGVARVEHEFRALRAMERVAIPTPRAYGWDPEGAALGAPAFLMDHIDGEPILPALLAAEDWAEPLFLDTVCALQGVTREQLGAAAGLLEPDDARAVLEDVCASFRESPDPLAEEAQAVLLETMPTLPEVRFSNGDLYPTNVLVKDRRLAGVVDFEHAGFTDPVYEFLLPFFMCPELRGRGTEERYCRRMGYASAALPWYRALEWFDTWRYAHRRGGSVEGFTEERCRRELEEALPTLR